MTSRHRTLKRSGTLNPSRSDAWQARASAGRKLSAANSIVPHGEDASSKDFVPAVCGPLGSDSGTGLERCAAHWHTPPSESVDPWQQHEPPDPQQPAGCAKRPCDVAAVF